MYITGAVAILISFTVCFTVVLIMGICHKVRKKEERVNSSTADIPNIMEANTAYGVENGRQAMGDMENDYSYPYTSPLSLMDACVVRPNEAYWRRKTTSAGASDAAAMDTEQPRSCDNEDDIYSYII